MAGRVAVDTTFLIDLQRERLQEDGPEPAHRMLFADPDLELYLPAVSLGEFAEGFQDPSHELLRIVRGRHTILPVDEEVALIYARLVRGQRSQPRRLGSNDLWIGATALRHALPLLTADAAAFRSIRGLEVMGYR